VSRSMYEDSIELVWGVISDATGEDLTTTPVELCVLPYPQQANDDSPWQPPDDEEMVGTTTKRVAVLVTGTKINGKTTKYTLWARITDTPEIPILKLGSFTVR
jgi:hypothetical protein